MSLFQRRGLMVAATLVTAASALVSCGEPSADKGASGATNASAAADEKVTITVYTSEPEEKVDEINAAFEESNPNISVEVYRAGTGDLNARIASEKESGEIAADVFWAADAATFEKYATDGDLAELTNVDTSGVIDEVKDDENMYVGTRIIPTVIAYNTDSIQESDAPKSWKDLTDAKYKDKIVMPNPAVSGAAAFNASVWKNNSDLGEEWIKALGATSPMIAESNGPTSQEIASGSRPVGVVVDYLIRDLAEQGSPVATAYPTEGVPYVTEPAGVFTSTKHKEAAEAYVSFLLSEEAQKIAVEQAYLPVREDVDTPEGTPALADIKLMEQDLEVITGDKEAAVKAFQEAVGQ